VEELGEPEAAPEKQAVVVMDRPAVASDTGVAVAAAGAAERGQAASSGEDLINRSGSEHGAGKAVEQIDLRSLAKQWTERVNQVLRHRVQTSYPLAARRMRHQGVVWLAVHVSPDGKIRTVELKRPSGHATLDRAALGILRTLERLPHPPVPLAPHLRRSPLTIPINFRLD